MDTPDLTPLYGIGGLPVGIVVAMGIWRWISPYLPERRDRSEAPRSDAAALEERIAELEAAVLPRRGVALDEQVREHERAIRALQAQQRATDAGMASVADLVDRVATQLPPDTEER